MSYLAYVTICCAVTYLLLLGVSAFTRPAGTARFLGAFAQTLPAHVLELALRVAVGAALIIRSPAMHFAQGIAIFGWILVGTSVLIALMPWRLHQRFARWSVPLATRRMRFLGVGATVAGLVVLYALVAPKAGFEANEAPTVIRVVSFVIAEGDEDAWSSACRRLVAAATAAHAEDNWLIHRVDERNHYLVSFGDLGDFRDSLSLVQGFARQELGVFADEFKQLRAVSYTVSSDEVWEQVSAWSTTSDMNSLTHPGVDERLYRVQPSSMAAADSVLTDMAGLLERERYPFPTEGFRVAVGDEFVIRVNSFFGDRDAYYSQGEPEAFLTARGQGERWLELVRRLNAITQDRSRTESRYVHELSYDPWLMEQVGGRDG